MQGAQWLTPAVVFSRSSAAPWLKQEFLFIFMLLNTPYHAAAPSSPTPPLLRLPTSLEFEKKNARNKRQKKEKLEGKKKIWEKRFKKEEKEKGTKIVRACTSLAACLLVCLFVMAKAASLSITWIS